MWKELPWPGAFIKANLELRPRASSSAFFKAVSSCQMPCLSSELQSLADHMCEAGLWARCSKQPHLVPPSNEATCTTLQTKYHHTLVEVSTNTYVVYPFQLSMHCAGPSRIEVDGQVKGSESSLQAEEWLRESKVGQVTNKPNIRRINIAISLRGIWDP